MKYFIEIPDDVQYVLLNGQTDNKCYTAVRPVAELEVLNSDYINENFGELQDEAYKQGYADAERIWRAPSSDNEFYQKGLEDAWEAAKKIVIDTDHGGIAMGTLCEIFDTRSYSYIMRENTAQEAIDKIKAYEDKKDRIDVGDEVATETGKKYTVVSFGDGGNVCGFNMEGKWTGWNPKKVTKTGKHYDIQSILEAMRK